LWVREAGGFWWKITEPILPNEEVGMFGSQILEVVIGLTLIFLVLSIGCSGVKEVIASVVGLRSNTLVEAVRNMLKNGDRDMAAELLQHPLIERTARPGEKPSYISARAFSQALLDVLAPPNGTQPRTMQDLRDGVAKLPDDKLRRTLLGFIDSSQVGLETARDKVEHWFDDTMARVSGWYKKRAQQIIFVVGFLLCAGLNGDAIMIVRELWSDEALRQAAVAVAQKQVQAGSPADASGQKVFFADVASEVRRANTPPIGWSGTPGDYRALPSTLGEWLLKILGILLSSFAIVLGAPFWFDVLNKVINVRLSGNPPKTTS
jgi:hypothetical protein